MRQLRLVLRLYIAAYPGQDMVTLHRTVGGDYDRMCEALDWLQTNGWVRMVKRGKALTWWGTNKRDRDWRTR